MDDTDGEFLDMDDPGHRRRLVEAIRAEGLSAFEQDIGGGEIHVVVPILDMDHQPYIIATDNPNLKAMVKDVIETWPQKSRMHISCQNLNTGCDIILEPCWGSTGETIVADEEDWDTAETIEEAVSIVKKWWKRRERLLRSFIAEAEDTH